MECAAKGLGSPCSADRPTRRCGICGALAYCSSTHQRLHWPYHKDECARFEQHMKNAHLLSDFPFTFFNPNLNQEGRCSLLLSKGLHKIGLWKSECLCESLQNYEDKTWFSDEWSLPNLLCPCSEPKTSLSKRLGCWRDYYEWRSLPYDSPVALLLHWPLTVYHCFQLLASKGLVSEVKEELHIHYLGPEKELLQLMAFGELRALFPGVQIHMELVGPDVSQFRDGETISLCRYMRCSEQTCLCKSGQESVDDKSNGMTSTVNIKLRSGLYHDRYASIIKESCPDLVIAPNAGIVAYSSWIPTIKLLKELGVPAVFTDFCEEAVYLAGSCISSVTGVLPRLPIQINPFRQPMLIEDSALYLPCYSNCFLVGL